MLNKVLSRYGRLKILLSHAENRELEIQSNLRAELHALSAWIKFTIPEFKNS